MIKPEISILMASYNKAQFIGEAIESVINQTYSNWELVIIDDCSGDNSVEAISKYLNDKRIILLENKKNIGTAMTQELLIKKAQADIVGVLDCDDALARNAIGEILKAYQRNQSVSFVYTQSYHCDENLKPLHLGDSGKISDNSSNLYCNLINHFKTFKKDCYLKTEGYDYGMLAAEDIDIIFKLEEVCNIHYIDKPLYYYRILPRSLTHGFKNEMINRSSTALAKLNAYKRRLSTDIPNLDKNEIAEVLFFGVFTAVLARRIKLMLKLKLALWKINPLFLFQPRFYSLLIQKIIKIIKIKIYNV